MSTDPYAPQDPKGKADDTLSLKEQVEGLEQTPWEVLDDDGGLPQPSQDSSLVIRSDEGAEG